jgi:hypothetical protein
VNTQPIHTSNGRKVERLWLLLGGQVLPVRRTGEKFYIHASFTTPLRINGRRDDVPAKLLSRLNQLVRMKAANDEFKTRP